MGNTKGQFNRDPTKAMGAPLTGEGDGGDGGDGRDGGRWWEMVKDAGGGCYLEAEDKMEIFIIILKVMITDFIFNENGNNYWANLCRFGALT